MTTDLQARLRNRAKRMNGALVGASDGGTYALGYYDQFAAADDKEAADRLDQLTAERDKQAARIQELEGALDDMLMLAEAEHVCLKTWNGTGSGMNYEGIAARARSALGRNAG